MTPLPARGEVWWCELDDVGRRPVVELGAAGGWAAASLRGRDLAEPGLLHAEVANVLRCRVVYPGA